MKTITQERLIKTIENINARLHKKIYREEKIVGYAVELGLKVACNSAFNKPTPQSDRDKFALELDFINASKDPDQLRLARERMVYQIHRFGDKCTDPINCKHILTTIPFPIFENSLTA